MKIGIVAAAGFAMLMVFGLSACSGDDAAPLVSSARAAIPAQPLYPALSPDAVEDTAYEYY